MKKLLLLALVLCGATFAQARVNTRGLLSDAKPGIQSVNIDAATVAAITARKAPSRAAEGTMNYSLAGEPYSALGAQGAKKGDVVSMAFEMTPEVANLYAGNAITAINFYQGVRNSNITTARKNRITEAVVFLTYDLNEKPFAVDSAKMTTEAFGNINVELSKPYTIEAGKAVYVGVSSVLTSPNDYAIVIDGMAHTGNEGGWVSLGEEWDNVTDYYGYCCVGATIEGSRLPSDMASVAGLDLPTYLTTGNPFSVRAYIRNQAANAINSIEITTKIGDDQAVAKTYEVPDGVEFDFGTVLYIDLECSYSKTGPTPVTVSVSKVNGVENADPTGTATANVFFLDESLAFNRTIVIEEFTGTWCGWCPRGIVAMEYVHENFSRDEVIGIAAHSGDSMEASSYTPVINAYANGYPAATVSRSIDIDPSVTEVVDAINQLKGLTMADIQGKVTFNADSTAVIFDTTTKFAFDDAKANYGIEYVLIEDSVGPYSQQNYYAGGGSGECGGWESKGGSVRTIYNEVARVLDTYGGVAGSVPASITAGTEYTYTHSVDVPKAVRRLYKLHAIAMLVDNNSGEIVNACQMEFDGFNGVNSAIADDDENAPVEYYNLQGIRVANPENGLFIRRQGKKVSKVAL